MRRTHDVAHSNAPREARHPTDARSGSACPRTLSRRAFVAGTVVGIGSWPAIAHAQSSEEGFTGPWMGTLTTGSRSFTVRIDIGLGPTARLTSVEESDTRMADQVTIRGDRIDLVFKSALARFEGTRVTPDRIEGEWRQTIYRLPLVLTRGAAAASPATAVLPLTADRLRALRESCGSPALGASWAGRDGRVDVLTTGRRSADRTDEVTPLDRWHVGSLTKSMTATLIASAVDAGEIAWSDTLIRHLPDVAGALDPEVQQLTFLELLSHRAGLAANLPDTELAAFSKTIAPSIEERRRFARLALALPRVGKPRETYAYSNNGYVIAAAMLEARLGRPWETLLIERVFRPLGVTTGGFGPPDAAAGAPVGHRESRLPRWLRSDRIPVRPSRGALADNVVAMGPAGRVHLSLSDLSRYLLAHRERERLLHASTWEVLHSPPFGGDYALGWERRADRTLWHNGSNTLWYAETLITQHAVSAAVANDGTLDLVMPAVGATLLAARAAAESASASDRGA